MNGYTSPTFKPLLADMARRAGHTVNEGDGATKPRWDWTESSPVLKGKTEQSRRGAKSARYSVTPRDWFEESEDEDGEDGDDGRDTDDEDVVENRLDRYLDAVEKSARVLLEQVRVLNGDRDRFVESEDEDEEDGDDEEVMSNRLDRYLDAMEKSAKALLEHVWALKGEQEEEVKRADDEDVTENRLDRYLNAVEKNAKVLLEQVRELKDYQEEKIQRREEYREDCMRSYFGEHLIQDHMIEDSLMPR